MNKIKVSAKDSLVSSVINGVINGAIAFSLFGDNASIPVSLDAISSNQVSVWSQAVSLTFGLGIILTLITAKLFCNQMKKQFTAYAELFSHPIFPNILRLAVGNAAVLFGWFVTLAVIWTKIFGVVMVSRTAAAVLVGLFAMIVTMVVEVRTKNSIIFRKTSIFTDTQGIHGGN